MNRGRGYVRVTSQPQQGFNKTELKHLGIALAVLTLAFAISFAGGVYNIFTANFPIFLAISFISVGTAFVFHELAHRKLARKYGCWAEFRMWRWGLMMALLFSLMGFVFAAPGAVVIRGHISQEQNGKISAAGPVTNWVVGVGFLIAALVSTIFGIGILFFVFSFVSYVNLFLGGFNLLPLGPLDGRKIFGWSAKYYLTLVGLIIGTFAVGYYLGPFTLFF